MITFRSDVADLILQRTLYDATSGLNNSIQRMTSGYKINQAKDNAANYSIVTDLSKQISSMLQVQQNSVQGIDLLTTAEGGLKEIKTLFERLRELATQAANGTYDNTSREAMQKEADQIAEQIEQIRASIEYNGLSLYETPKEDNNPITRLSKSVRITSTGDTGIKTDCDTSYTFTSTEEEESSFNTVSSPAVFSGVGVNQGVNDTGLASNYKLGNTSQNGENVGSVSVNDDIMLLSASDPIDGAESFGANETRTITIDGVQYTVTNREACVKDLLYSKNTSTGEITFTGNYFTIKGQTDVAHKILISGTNNYVYGGDMNDYISNLSSQDKVSYLYGGKGDDYLLAMATGTKLYGQDGDDTLISNVSYVTLDGGIGNDTISLTGSNSKIYGGDGDDNITLVGNRGVNTIDGGSGTNTYTGTFENNTVINVVGATDIGIDFLVGETKNLTINGINYTVTNNGTAGSTFIYSVDSTTGQIIFQAQNFTIVGDKNVSHNVKINSSNIIFHGGNLKDIITTGGQGNGTIYAYGGDNEITIEAYAFRVYAGDGNNVIVSKDSTGLYGNYFSLGNGNNTVTLNGQCNLVRAGGGNNVIVNNGSNNFISGFGDNDNCSVIKIDANSTKTVAVNGINYTIQNNLSEENYLFYDYNAITDEVILAARQLNITGQDGVEHNVQLYGQHNYFYGGNLNDTITASGANTCVHGRAGDDTILIYNGYVYGDAGNDTFKTYTTGGSTLYYYGGEGDDTFILDRSLSGTYGEAGNDTYYVNANAIIQDSAGNNIYHVKANNATITGSDGNDTFYISGTDNQINGAGGNDYFIIDGDNNAVNGGTGTNYYVDNATGTSVSLAVSDPNMRVLSFTALNESKSFTLDGKTYTVTNKISGTNSLQCSRNENTGVVTVNASGIQIDTTLEASQTQGAILNIRGNNNIINGSQLIDKITVEQGSNNTINGLGGNDVLTSETTNNSISGGDGNDTININASTNKDVIGGPGDDTFNIASDNNTNLIAGAGNNTINLNGANNTITAENGNNTVIVNDVSNNISLGSGNNKLTVLSNNNTITAQNGNNNIGIQGEGNTINAGAGNNTINLNGNNNEVETTNGNNTIIISKDENTVVLGNGRNDLSIGGNLNNITTGTNNDSFLIQGNSNTISTSGGNNSATIKGSSNNYNGGTGVDTINISGDSNIVKGGEGDDKFGVKSGTNNSIDGEGGYNTVFDKGNATTFTNANLITFEPFELNIKVDIGSGDDTFIKTSIGFSLLDFEIDLRTSEKALLSIQKINEMLKTLDEQLLNIGTTINRLQSVAEAQAVKLNNLISTRSTLRDADIADESSGFIKYQILQQASATLMASSRNLKAESVLGLLQGIQG